MIVAIEIKSTEECPIRRFPEMDYCNILLKRCIGLESLDCPMRAIRCETCKHYEINCVVCLLDDHGYMRPTDFCSDWQVYERIVK